MVEIPNEEQKAEIKKNNRKFCRANNIIKKVGSCTVRMNQMISNNFICVSKRDRRTSIKHLNLSDKKIGTVENHDSKQQYLTQLPVKESINKFSVNQNWNYSNNKNNDIDKWSKINLQRIDTQDLFEMIDEEVHARNIVLFNSNESKLATSRKTLNLRH